MLFASFCDLLSFPYSCNWLAFSCSLLFSLCSSFFAFPYFLLSACLCLLRLAIFPFSCCFSLCYCCFCLARYSFFSFPYSWSLQLSLCSPLLWRAPPASGRGRRILRLQNTTFSIFAPIAVITLTQQAEIHIMDARSSMLQSQCVLIVSGFVMPNLPREHYENSRIILCTAAFSLFSGVTSVLASTLSKNLDFQNFQTGHDPTFFWTWTHRHLILGVKQRTRTWAHLQIVWHPVLRPPLLCSLNFKAKWWIFFCPLKLITRSHRDQTWYCHICQ